MNLLELLGLAHKQQAQAQAAAPIQYPRPVVTPGDEPLPGYGQAAAPAASPEQSLDVVGKEAGFHARKPSLLAILGDAMLVHGGYKPMFSQNRRDEDYRRAVQDYTTDPLQAIKNLSQLKGHEQEMIKLKEAYDTGQMDDAVKQSLIDYRKAEQQQKARSIVGSMFNGVNDDATYQAILPTARRYGEVNGLDTSLLGDTFDPDKINAFRQGGLTVDQADDNNRQERNLQSQMDYRRQSLGLRGQEVSNQTRNVNSEISNRSTRTQEYLRRGQVTAPGQGGRNALAAAKARANKVFRDQRGLVEFDKTGNKMRVTAPDGRMWGYGYTPDGKVKFMGQMDANGNLLRKDPNAGDE